MPNPSNDQHPDDGPERSDGPDDGDLSSASRSDSRADAYDSLVPLLERRGAQEGTLRLATPDEGRFAAQFMRLASRFFERPLERSLVVPDALAVKAVDRWSGSPVLMLAAQFTNDAGQFVLPPELAVDERVQKPSGRFWDFSGSETFRHPAGVMATIQEFRSGKQMVDVDPIFSPSAQDEAVSHARFVASSVKAHPQLLRHEFKVGSIVVAMLLSAVEVSHLQGDPGVGGGTGSSGVLTDPALQQLLGLASLELEVEPQTHRIGVLALDPRVDFQNVAGGKVPVSLPLIRKTYDVLLVREAGYFDAPKPLRVSVEKYDRAS